MSRDFLITFKNKHDAEQAEKKLQSFEVDNSVKLFSEIKKKESEIFLSLTYSQEINKDTKCKSDLEEFLLYEHVNFVAVKNGKHNSKGYAYFSEGLKNLIPEENSNICKINESIKNYCHILLDRLVCKEIFRLKNMIGNLNLDFLIFYGYCFLFQGTKDKN